MRVSLCLVLLALAACGDPKPVITTPHIASDVGLLTVHQARCAACHSLGGALDVQLRGDAAAPLASFANQVDAAAGLPDLGSHFSGFGMSVAAADDLRAWLRSLAGERQARNFADVSGGAIPRTPNAVFTARVRKDVVSMLKDMNPLAHVFRGYRTGVYVQVDVEQQKLRRIKLLSKVS